MGDSHARFDQLSRWLANDVATVRQLLFGCSDPPLPADTMAGELQSRLEAIRFDVEELLNEARWQTHQRLREEATDGR